MFINASAGTNGTGFMIKKSLIDEEGFSTSTLTEDIEFTTQCILKGRRIGFVENAITYDEQTSNCKDSIRQKSRWTSGNLQTLSKYRFQLFKEFIKTGNFSIFDLWLKLLMPHNQVFGISFSIFSLLYFNKFDLIGSLKIGITSLLVSYLAQIILGIVIVYYYKKNDFVKMMDSIIMFPLFLISWFFVNIKCFIYTDKTWKPIKHSRNININELPFSKKSLKE
jgi:cellulose synthase/poly-beta-1,6-N-acetylglucosamine synthase-like glycosyltransferase